MKKLNYCWSFVIVLSLLFTSCSKEETDVTGPDSQDTFQLQFGTLLNDFAKQTKDHLSGDPVECRVADPSYVLVALTNSSDDWVAGMNPEADANDFIKINVKNNNGSWETQYSDVLGLPAGTYKLQYFIVYSADDQVLWVAPREGGAYAGSVADALPQTIELGAGTKPYVDVDVLCYVPRMEEAFGYIFFDINLIRITNNYCIFVNFCDDGTGREYPAKFMVDVWSDALDGDDQVVDGVMNSVSGSGNSFAATVLCFPLPPLEDGVYYVRVTVMDTDAYDTDGSDIFEFEIDQDDIDGQLDLTPRYRHIRINCDDNPGGGDDCASKGGDADGDGICDDDDDCINGVGTGCNPGGGDDCASNGGDADEDGICDNEDDCVNGVGSGCNPGGGEDCDETAYMQGGIRFSEIQGGPGRWGWIEDFDIATDNGNSYNIYAGASNQYNLNDNTRIGDVTITFNDETNMVKLTFDFENSLNGFSKLHVNISENIPPKQTLQAPGQYNNNQYGSVSDGDSFLFPWNGDGDFYIVVHGADSCKDGGSDD